ncbi:BTB domain-containing protein [Mycena chlorophos]|uniref:BTB domain-containing protein n=1 Tax=Mycena chlorophos TaxID=658473 RepID=A0A8H6TM06_MYCCL|nr:BTB domain-containing protein [Mycena chlorophos]
MTDEPPAKRQRTSSPDPATPTRSDKFWLPYGDIVLVVNLTMFRVNRDVLRLQSSVFSDMFSVPQPNEGQSTIEDCPVVHLSGDDVGDWNLVLDALYHPWRQKLRLEVDMICAMLRLGRKYDMIEVTSNALARVRNDFPGDFEQWADIPDGGDMVDSQPETAALLQLLETAHEFGLWRSYPTIAYGILLWMPISKLAETFPHPKQNISPDRKLVLAVAAKAITEHQKEQLAWLLTDETIPSDACTSPETCASLRTTILRRMLWGPESEEPQVKMTMLWHWAGSMLGTWTEKLCKECNEAGRPVFQQHRDDAWAKLPTFFGLSPWEELKDALELETEDSA